MAPAGPRYTERSQPDRLEELRASARGWSGVQLAVLGFIALCGVLAAAADAPGPRPLHVAAGLLALAALAIACVATYLVARAAWPLDHREPVDPGVEVKRSRRRLTRGVTLTFVAVAVLAVASAAGWWPDEEPARPAVEAQTTAGGTWCGRPVAARQGILQLEVSGQLVPVPFDSLAALRAVKSCD